MKHRTLIGSLALAALLWSASAAQAQPDAAKRFLQQKHDAVMRVLRRPAGDARAAELTRMLGDLLDYEELSKRALGSHWETKTSTERERFVALLRQLVERSYQQSLERTVSFDVSYGSAEAVDGGVLVHTEARSRTNRRQPPVAIDYRLRRVGSTWKVFDLATDGVSMVQNYRNQFDRIIERDGWDGLLERMEKRLSDQS